MGAPTCAPSPTMSAECAPLRGASAARRWRRTKLAFRRGFECARGPPGLAHPELPPRQAFETQDEDDEKEAEDDEEIYDKKARRRGTNDKEKTESIADAEFIHAPTLQQHEKEAEEDEEIYDKKACRRETNEKKKTEPMRAMTVQQPAEQVMEVPTHVVKNIFWTRGSTGKRQKPICEECHEGMSHLPLKYSTGCSECGEDFKILWMCDDYECGLYGVMCCTPCAFNGRAT